LTALNWLWMLSPMAFNMPIAATTTNARISVYSTNP